MASYLEVMLIRTAVYIENQCMPSSESDTDFTVMSESKGSENVESYQWVFEETTGDKISNGNAFEPCGFSSLVIFRASCHFVSSLVRAIQRKRY